MLPRNLPFDSLFTTIADSADDAIVSKDLDGIVTSWNRGAENVFGYAALEMIGHSIRRIIPDDRQGEEEEILARIRRGERVDHLHTVRRRKDGKLVPVSVTISPVHDPDGRVVGASKIARDLTSQQEAAATAALLKAIVDSSEDAVVSKDLNGIVTSWNRGAQSIFGYTAEEMIGQPIWRLFPPDRWDEEPQILQRIQRGERVEHFETKRVCKDGRPVDISVSISPIRDRHGRIIGASKIARNITQQKEAHDRLVAAHEELQRADRLKSEFLATLSHELRTPLNAILGWVHVLKEGGDNLAEVREGLAVIERNARAQAQMVEDLLDVSRIASGKVLLDIQQVNLATIVEAAMETLQPAALGKDIRVSSAFASVEGIIMGDRNRLQQVFWNLLSNAIKFTPKRGRVHVTIQRRFSHVEVAINDTGQGIAPEFLPHVFERFRQGDATTSRRHGGLGLGLSIVKQLIELHGGLVQVSSPGEGHGTTFSVALPIVAANPSAAERPSSHEARIEEVPNLPLHGVRVLTVDDEPDSLEVVARILKTRGAEVVMARSAAEGLAAIEAERPDLLISDIGMPEQDGYDFIRRVRQKERFMSLPAIALTALARTEDRTRAMRAGFQTHVAKPVAPDELVAVAVSLLSLRGRRAAGSLS